VGRKEEKGERGVYEGRAVVLAPRCGSPHDRVPREVASDFFGLL